MVFHNDRLSRHQAQDESRKSGPRNVNQVCLTDQPIQLSGARPTNDPKRKRPVIMTAGRCAGYERYIELATGIRISDF